MTADFSYTETECNLLVLNYASILLNQSHNHKQLVEVALESIVDFSKADSAALFFFDENTGQLRMKGLFADERIKHIRNSEAPLLDDADLKVVFSSSYFTGSDYFPDACRKIMEPWWGQCQEGCLCIPIVNIKNKKHGAVFLRYEDKRQVGFEHFQYLRQFMTVLAIAVDNYRLFEMAVVDGLTGLFVRRYYDLRIKEELARLKRLKHGCLVVTLIDMDNFKKINDTFGHPEGDRVLREFAGILQGCIRRDIDIACRYGGEEFIVLMPETSMSQALHAAHRLQNACAEHDFKIQNHKVSFSAGLASCHAPGLLSPEEILKTADSRLYQAKQSGRNKVVWNDSSICLKPGY